jgi:hypothetical protein
MGLSRGSISRAQDAHYQEAKDKVALGSLKSISAANAFTVGELVSRALTNNRTAHAAG